MLVAFFLFEAPLRDVLAPAIKVASYAETVRRTVVDIAAKIFHKGHQVVLRVTQAACQEAEIQEAVEEVQ